MMNETSLHSLTFRWCECVNVDVSGNAMQSWRGSSRLPINLNWFGVGYSALKPVFMSVGDITWLLTQELPDAATAFSVTKGGGDEGACWMPPSSDQNVIRDKEKVMSLNPFITCVEFTSDPQQQQRNKDGQEKEEEAFVDYLTGVWKKKWPSSMLIGTSRPIHATFLISYIRLETKSCRISYRNLTVKCDRTWFPTQYILKQLYRFYSTWL